MMKNFRSPFLHLPLKAGPELQALFPPKNDAENPSIFPAFSADEPTQKPLGVSREPARAKKRTPDASARYQNVAR